MRYLRKCLPQRGYPPRRLIGNETFGLNKKKEDNGFRCPLFFLSDADPGPRGHNIMKRGVFTADAAYTLQSVYDGAPQ